MTAMKKFEDFAKEEYARLEAEAEAKAKAEVVKNPWTAIAIFGAFVFVISFVLFAWVF